MTEERESWFAKPAARDTSKWFMKPVARSGELVRACC